MPPSLGKEEIVLCKPTRMERVRHKGELEDVECGRREGTEGRERR